MVNSSGTPKPQAPLPLKTNPVRRGEMCALITTPRRPLTLFAHRESRTLLRPHAEIELAARISWRQATLAEQMIQGQLGAFCGKAARVIIEARRAFAGFSISEGNIGLRELWNRF